jgi:hypothetical protein
VLTLRDLRFRFEVLRREERRAALVIGASRAVMALVAFLLVYFLFDRFFAPPMIGRWAVALTGLSGVAWLFYTGVYANVSRTSSDDEIAERIEELHPELNGSLLSFVQLARTRDEGRLLASPVLMQALEEETLAAVARFSFLEIVPRELARVSLLAACFAVVVQVACLVLLPWHFVALGARLIDPACGFPTRTRIETMDVPAVVACGAEIPVVVRLERGSVLPTRPGLLTFTDRVDGTTIEAELAAEAESGWVFRGTLPRAVDDVEVVAELGDARSEPRLIRAVPRPEVKEGTVRYRWPAYLKREDIPSKPLGPLDVLQGGTLELDLEATAPLRDALLVERYGDSWPLMPVDEGGLRWRLREPFNVTRQTSFHIWMRDADGITNALPAVEYPVLARPDRPPEITLQYPSRDLSITPKARMLLRFDVRDDFGLRAVRLAYRIELEGQKEQKVERVPLTGLAADQAGRILPEQQVVWNLARQGFKTGDQVVFWLEADDDCPANDAAPAKVEGAEGPVTGPLYAKTPEIRLTLVSPEEKTLELQTRIARLYDDLNGLKGDQEDLKGRVRELLRRLGAMQEPKE